MKGSARLFDERSRARLIRWITSVPIEGDGLAISWKPYEEKRRDQQNRLLWVSAYKPIAAHMSEQSGKVITPEHVHDACKAMFLRGDTNPVTGEPMAGSTTGLSVKAFSDYLEQVYAWGAGMGVWFEDAA